AAGIRGGHVTGVQTCALPISAKLVPPATVRFTLLLSRNPFVQLPVTLVKVSLEQKRYPALLGEELSEISGTKRNVPDGMPVTPEIGRASCRERQDTVAVGRGL